MLEGRTTGKLCVLSVVNGRKVLVNEGSIGQWPEAFCWLQLGRIWGQEDQMDVLGDL